MKHAHSSHIPFPQRLAQAKRRQFRHATWELSFFFERGSGLRF